MFRTAIEGGNLAAAAGQFLGNAGHLFLGHAETRHPTAAQAVRDAEGPVLVVTSDPRTWSETKDARAKLGPVLLYDPTHRCDTPARLHWSPAAGCEDKATAAARAAALLAPVRPTAKVDHAMADVAGEVAAEIATLPPSERRAAGIRAAALASAANHLLTGGPTPSPR